MAKLISKLHVRTVAGFKKEFSGQYVPFKKWPSMPCCCCPTDKIRKAHYRVGKQGFCDQHKTEAWAAQELVWNQSTGQGAFWAYQHEAMEQRKLYKAKLAKLHKGRKGFK